MNATMNSQTQTFNHLLPLDFDNVSTLPDSHAWSTTTFPSDDSCHHPIDGGEPLPPVIDIGEPVPSSAAVLAAHGTEAACCTAPSGATGYGLTRISPFFPKLMWSEGFGMMGSPEEHDRQLWPQDHAKFCELMEQWQAEMKTLCEKIVGMMLCSLGLTDEEDMKWFEPISGCDGTQCVLQLNSYPSNINGLQVYKDGVGWVGIEPVEGALVVNVGDLMHIVSNGQFKSVLHRAVVNKTCHRVSTAFFYGTPWDAKVSPLKKLVDSDHPPLYRPVKWKEYLQIKKTDFSSALESIRL
ncbi:LisH dimerization motif,WD40/YVTN repeat-like-containing domain isoform 1 [Hibiscus syriacus]|uniref:LisH dimerization motif,WD40/YVTN repeat-like-containing domain isoform 1 n=1 Tax=Hibiscus syriacus TaxID=106335 RepID=A0A6A2XQJ0_HIBSY|nr:LisH dimerization motif,WD40/YVTN repeat-like-containing domain isoform 1 [Hibiscus syriacus]